MKIYRARTFGIVNIHSDVGPPTFLNPRLDVKRISPTGFGWGYTGPGALQLSIALICDVTGNHLAAETMYQALCERLVSKLNRNAPLDLTEQRVKDVLLKIDDGDKAAARERSGRMAGEAGLEPAMSVLETGALATKLHSRK